MTDEQRAQRVHHHTYETCEGIREHAERITKLEELVFDALSVLLGWAMALNELSGYEQLDNTTVPSQTFAQLQIRARELEVPDV